MRTRLSAIVVLVLGASMIAAPAASAQTRASGGVTVFDATDCPGHANSAKVTPPFSIGITGLAPSSTDALIYVTDKDAKPEVVYGPATLEGVDAHGSICINLLFAPPGLWKIDVVDPSNGYKKSKVFTVESAPTTTTRPKVTTTTRPKPIGSTTTPTSTSSTRPPSTTTDPANAPETEPFPDLPWTLERPEQIGPPPSVVTTTTVTNTSPGSLPQTGPGSAVPLGGLAVALLTLGAFTTSTTRRRRY
jgi:hypothetical protein